MRSTPTLRCWPRALGAPLPSQTVVEAPRAADAIVFGMLVLGGVGVILFCRDRGWHAGGALVAALAFSFGGSAASRIQHKASLEIVEE